MIVIISIVSDIMIVIISIVSDIMITIISIVSDIMIVLMPYTIWLLYHVISMINVIIT